MYLNIVADKNKETDKQTSQIPEINTMKKPKPAKIFEPSPNREDLDSILFKWIIFFYFCDILYPSYFGIATTCFSSI